MYTCYLGIGTHNGAPNLEPNLKCTGDIITSRPNLECPSPNHTCIAVSGFVLIPKVETCKLGS